MVAATLAFTVMIALVKTLQTQTEMATLDIMFWRGVFGTPPALLLARRGGAAGGVTVVRRDLILLRAVLGSGAMFCFYSAARSLSVASLSFIHKLQPIAVALAAPWLLGRGERVGARVWVVLALGVAGCALLLAPGLGRGGGASSAGGLWALGAVALSAAAHLTVRKLGRSDRPAVVVLWFQLLMTVGTALALGAVVGRGPRLAPAAWPAVVGVGLSAVAGQFLLTTAYRRERAGTVAAASYVQAVWALLVDLIVFGRVPTGRGVTGGALIVAGGLLLSIRHRDRGGRPKR
ncbi:MAG: DMT family transporter [Myxococcota bacterium]